MAGRNYFFLKLAGQYTNNVRLDVSTAGHATDVASLHGHTYVRAGFSWWGAWGSHGRNFGLKSGGTKLEAPKAPRIKMPKASSGMKNGEGTPRPSQSTIGRSGQWSNYRPIIIYEGDVKYGEQ